MNTKNLRLTPRGPRLAVLLAGAALSIAGGASAQDDAAALVKPTNTVELGIGDVFDSTYKANEYNGVRKNGGYVVGGFDLRGGGAYDSGDATRWSLTGTNLGLYSRDILAEYGQQGRYRIRLEYDELLRNRSDSFQTPYLGVGSTTLTLPDNWVLPEVKQNSGTNATSLSSSPNARGLSPVTGLNATGAFYPASPTPQNKTLTPAAQAYMQSILDNDVPAFQNQNLSTLRRTYKAGFDFNVDRHWSTSVSANHMHRTGLQPISTITAQSGGDIATVLPLPIDQTTDQFNAALNYRNGGKFVSAAYYGSLFHNDVQALSWQNWAMPTAPLNVMSSAPNNQFHQATLTGGYDFSRSTRLVADVAYARGTQNQTFQSFMAAQEVAQGLPSTAPGVVGLFNGVNSLNGLVVTETAHLKFTTRPLKDLLVTAAYKYQDRDNKTPVNTFAFYDVGAAAAGNNIFNAPLGLAASTLGTNVNIESTRPYSKRLNQADLDGDYALGRAGNVKLGYQFQQVQHYCDGDPASCADAATTKENTLSAEYRFNRDSVQGRLGYAHSIRTASDYNENAFLALVPMAYVVPDQSLANTGGYNLVGIMQAFGLTGFGPHPPTGYPLGATSGKWTADQWASVLAINAANISSNQLAALNYFFANGNAAPSASYGSRNVISELDGLQRYNMDGRVRDRVRSMVDWQATDRLSVQGSGSFNRDSYTDALFGLQSAWGWSGDLDASYAAAGGLVVDFFYTHEDQRSRMRSDAYGSENAGTGSSSFVGQSGNTLAQSCSSAITTVAQKNQNAKLDPCLQWGMSSMDRADTLGLTLRKDGLFTPKLDLYGDVTYTRARTDYNVTGGSYVNNPLALAAPAPALAAGTPAIFYIPAAAFPSVTTDSVALHLGGTYRFTASHSVRAGYAFQHLKATDYAYQGMQFGSLSGILPSNETAPAFNVHTVMLSYIYSFR